MKNTQSSNKAKNVILGIVSILICVLLGGLIASVVTKTTPKDWFNKPHSDAKSGTLAENDVIAFSEDAEGLPLYVNRNYDDMDSLFSFRGQNRIFAMFSVDDEFVVSKHEGESRCAMLMSIKDGNNIVFASSDEQGVHLVLLYAGDDRSDDVFGATGLVDADRFVRGNVQKDGRITLPEGSAYSKDKTYKYHVPTDEEKTAFGMKEDGFFSEADLNAMFAITPQGFVIPEPVQPTDPEPTPITLGSVVALSETAEGLPIYIDTSDEAAAALNAYVEEVKATYMSGWEMIIKVFFLFSEDPNYVFESMEDTGFSGIEIMLSIDNDNYILAVASTSSEDNDYYPLYRTENGEGFSTENIREDGQIVIPTVFGSLTSIEFSTAVGGESVYAASEEIINRLFSSTPFVK